MCAHNTCSQPARREETPFTPLRLAVQQGASHPSQRPRRPPYLNQDPVAHVLAPRRSRRLITAATAAAAAAAIAAVTTAIAAASALAAAALGEAGQVAAVLKVVERDLRAGDELRRVVRRLEAPRGAEMRRDPPRSPLRGVVRCRRRRKRLHLVLPPTMLAIVAHRWHGSPYHIT